MSSLLCVQDLVVRLGSSSSSANSGAAVVDGASLRLEPGEALALVGESGCGKSTLLAALVDLLPPTMRRTSGEVRFDNRDLTLLDPKVRRRTLGREIGVVFQEPTRSLNPVLSIGEQVAEVLRCHLGLAKRAAWTRSVELLDEVGIEQPDLRARNFPHQLSGGMNQRVAIAIAIACSPRLLLVDEPTTALDVTVQKEILELFRRLRADHEMALLFVSHDLAVVQDHVDRACVMYAGRIVESAPVRELFEHPQHPYTRGLLDCRPSRGEPHQRLFEIGGTVPTVGSVPTGCGFHPRCDYREARCAEELPTCESERAARSVACFYPLDDSGLREASTEGGPE